MIEEKDSKPTSAPAEKTDELGRKIWDKEFFANKALQRGDDDLDLSLLGETTKKKEPPPPHLRRPLQQRETDFIELEKELGKTKVVTAHTPKQGQGGYYCDTCECLIKDSQAYLDHINGKKHNRLLGMTMRVERVSASRVRGRLQQLAKQRKTDTEKLEADVEGRLQAGLEEEEEKRKRRADRKREKKRLKQTEEAEVGETFEC